MIQERLNEVLRPDSGGMARVIYDAAHQRLGAVGAERMRVPDAALDFGTSL